MGLLTSPLLSSPVWALSLDEAVQQGLSIHPAVSAAEARVAEVGTQVEIARDGYWPTLQALAGPENSLWGEFGYDITASQMLYDWGRVRSRVESASAVERQHLEALKVTSDEAALDIIEVYLDVLAAEARLSVVASHIERLEALAELSRDRSLVGYVDRGEADRAELELARALEQRSLERGALSEARAQFRELVDRSPGGLQWPTPIPLIERLRETTALEAAVAEAPLFRQAREEVLAARAEEAESRAALRPQLNLEGSVLRREIGGRMEEDAVVALRLRMDAFQGLSNFRRVESARQRIEAAQWTQRATRRDLRRQLFTLLELAEMLEWRLEAVEAQHTSAVEVADAYQEQFEVGLRELNDLLVIQRDRFEAERQRVDLVSEQTRIPYRAAAQLGRLDALLDADHGQGVEREVPYGNGTGTGELR
ncbi:TolC family protein [Halomonas heilongjiangensis]|uniref:TolC family protein n=1 Tax=Halomonas heilongjiangensis TaxID=1387883 RepID=A0A2N7TH74_9GAMM|nr:TolC family protein [Halomonas heilongjiangensis]PMR67545.1 hypothetical protein C1H66_19650 [Halomonas heilongjiangensis]PXX87013.1 hypothetical protein CR158_20420 [Halomonas heilongjiangensis]